MVPSSLAFYNRLFLVPKVDRSGCVCLSSDSPSRTGGHQTVGPRLSPAHSDWPRVAQHAMVLGPGQHVSSSSPLTSLGGVLVTPTIQLVSSQGSLQPESSCLAPRVSAINKQVSVSKWQHEVKLLRDVTPELCTSQSGLFLSDGVRKIRWTPSLPL